MKNLSLIDGPVRFEGAVSLDVTEQGVIPWRLMLDQIQMFEPGLRSRAASPSGVRLTLVSDTTCLAVHAISPRLPGCFDPAPWTFDLLVDGVLHQRITNPMDDPLACQVLRFENLPRGEHRLELYLDVAQPIQVQKVQVDDSASAKAFEDTRPRWVVYGSSITHCRSSQGPSETWPVLVANRFDLNLTSLGYGGNCHMEPMVCRMIGQLPADYISTCVGINVHGGQSLSPRTFRASVIGMIQSIRDGHPETPLMVVSPICCPPRETTPNEVGLNLPMIRQMIAEAVTLFREQGDDHLYYHDGLELFGEEFVSLMPDQLHPSALGTRLLGQRYAQQVMLKFGLEPSGPAIEVPDDILTKS